MAIWRGSVNTLTDLQALDTTFMNENTPVFVKDEEKWYFWDSASTETISSPDVVGKGLGLLSTSLADGIVFLELEETGEPFIDAFFNSNFNEETNTVVNQIPGIINNAVELTQGGSDVGIVAANKFEIHSNTDSTINFWWKYTELSVGQWNGTMVEVTDSYKLEKAGGFFRQTTDDGVGTSSDLFAIDPVFVGVPLDDWVMVTILWDHNLRRTTIIMNLRGIAYLETTRDPQIQAGNNLLLFTDSVGLGNHAIDDLGIWSRILTPREIQLLYNKGNAYPVNTADFASGRWITVKGGGVATDELVKTTTNDTTSDFLQSKLVAGTNTTINLLNPAANEQLEIVSQDELAKVSSDDTTPDYLEEKFAAGIGITLNTLNPGADEQLEITSTAVNNFTVKQEFSEATPSIADLASADITINSARALMIGRVSTDVEATVRLYSSIAARTADSARPLGTPPASGTEGLITEVQTTTGNLDIDLSDAVNHVNLEDPQLSEVYATVFNESGGNSVVTVTLCAHVIGNVIVGSGDVETYSETTASIADLASDDINIPADRALLIGKISADFASTIRLYNSIAARIADSGRALGAVPPPSTEGLIAEVQPTLGNLEIDLSPSIGFISLEDPQTQFIYATVFNESGGNQAITVTIKANPIGGTSTDERVRVSSNDADTGYLTDKIVAGPGIAVAELNDAGSETFRISATGNLGLQTFAGATSLIADGSSEEVDITTSTLTKFAVARIVTDVEALVRLYTSKANRTADASRLAATPPPTSIRGLVTEVQTTTGDLTIDLSALPTHINLETIQVAEIYATIFNQSGGNAIVNVTIYGE